MIKYTLKCETGHQFDSWFQSAAGFDVLKAAGHVACAVCGSVHVEKTLMAPKVRPARKGAALPPPEETGPSAPFPRDLAASDPQPSDPQPRDPQPRDLSARDLAARDPNLSAGPDLSAPASALEAQIAQMRAHLEATSDDVGENFASQARAMHEGDVPERPIYGQANAKEAKKLIEDGVPVLPLPFIPTRKTN